MVVFDKWKDTIISMIDIAKAKRDGSLDDYPYSELTDDEIFSLLEEQLSRKGKYRDTYMRAQDYLIDIYTGDKYDFDQDLAKKLQIRYRRFTRLCMLQAPEVVLDTECRLLEETLSIIGI